MDNTSLKTVTDNENININRYAELRYGKIYEIYQSSLPLNEFMSLFSPTATFVDITGLKDTEGNPIEVGSTYNGKTFGPNLNFFASDLEDHKIIAQERRDNMVKKHIIDGINVTHEGVTYHYNLEEVDQSNIKTYYEASTASPTSEFIIRVTNVSNGEVVKLNHNAEMIRLVMIMMSNHIQECKKVSWRMDEDIQNALTIDDVYSALNWEKL